MLFREKINFLNPLVVEKNEQIFYLENIKEGDVVFDVGANVGELTLLFSRFAGNNGRVHSFEPTSTTFEKLSNIVMMCNKKNITLNNIAVSEMSGTINFNIYTENYSSWNSIAKRPLASYGISIASPKSLEIPSISVDDYCSKNAIDNIDLLKIDVEGAEYKVLIGADRMFTNKQIRLCVFEFGQTIFDMGNTIEELKDFFSRHKYRVGNVSKKQNIFPVDERTKMGCFSVLFAKPM